MNTTPHHHPIHPEASLRDAGIGEIFQDLMRLGPAPNASREALVTVVTVVIFGAIIAVLKPEPTVTGVITVAAVVYVAVRWVLGLRKWAQR